MFLHKCPFSTEDFILEEVQSDVQVNQFDSLVLWFVAQRCY
nr:MAG TPA: 5-aminolevulinate synthase [Caudoviricetes sp.]